MGDCAPREKAPAHETGASSFRLDAEASLSAATTTAAVTTAAIGAALDLAQHFIVARFETATENEGVDLIAARPVAIAAA